MTARVKVRAEGGSDFWEGMEKVRRRRREEEKAEGKGKEKNQNREGGRKKAEG